MKFGQARGTRPGLVGAARKSGNHRAAPSAATARSKPRPQSCHPIVGLPGTCGPAPDYPGRADHKPPRRPDAPEFLEVCYRRLPSRCLPAADRRRSGRWLVSAR
ncbi:hypothetical protein GCM10028821_39660 [Hymenobacter jeollabukensis]